MLGAGLAEGEAPAAGYGDRKDAPGAAVARAIMERASVGREARLWYGGPSRDRYQRAIAHVIAKDEVGADVWLDGVAARQGAARGLALIQTVRCRTKERGCLRLSPVL